MALTIAEGHKIVYCLLLRAIKNYSCPQRQLCFLDCWSLTISPYAEMPWKTLNDHRIILHQGSSTGSQSNNIYNNSNNSYMSWEIRIPLISLHFETQVNNNNNNNNNNNSNDNNNKSYDNVEDILIVQPFFLPSFQLKIQQAEYKTFHCNSHIL